MIFNMDVKDTDSISIYGTPLYVFIEKMEADFCNFIYFKIYKHEFILRKVKSGYEIKELEQKNENT